MYEKCLENAERITAVEARASSAHHRIDELKENQKVLLGMNANLERLVEQNKHQNEKIENIEKDVTTLKDKPAKRWDLMITGVISAVVSALAGFMMAGLLN